MACVMPESPSTTSTLLMEMAGGESSFRMVPTAAPSAMATFVGSDRSIVNDSSNSSSSSPTTPTRTWCDVSPGAKVTVSEDAA